MGVEQGFGDRRRGDAVGLHQDRTLGVRQGLDNEAGTVPPGREIDRHRQAVVLACESMRGQRHEDHEDAENAPVMTAQHLRNFVPGHQVRLTHTGLLQVSRRRHRHGHDSLDAGGRQS
jgi:hypothetical protein